RRRRRDRRLMAEDREAVDAEVLEPEALAAAEREPRRAADPEDLRQLAVERDVDADRADARDRLDLHLDLAGRRPGEPDGALDHEHPGEADRQRVRRVGLALRVEAGLEDL